MQDARELVPHMAHVQEAQRDLKDLGLVWQMIESSAAIGCPDGAETILPTLGHARERFDALQQQLVGQMAQENRAALGDQLSAKAQCTIDILVRNLFERTADVGFLATDDVVRRFCAAAGQPGDPTGDEMHERLREYVAKYSVYDDVLLLRPSGEILVRLDRSAELARSTDPIVARALRGDGFVEQFARSDLSADGQPALLYAHRICDTERRTLGVLVLRFRLADELQRVFAAMEDERHELALVLLDASQHVIATNDAAHIPLGAVLRRVPEGSVALTSFAGREYLAVTCHGTPYQGYQGPRWRAQAMVSLLTAFRQVHAEGASAQLEVPVDNDALHRIQDHADEINRGLRRVVWNGQLMAGLQQTASRPLKAVLQQVDQAGRRTRERVSRAIRDLHRTSLARMRQQVGDLARLAADIMDRNLYERANDCRWWALSPALQAGLAEPASAENAAVLGALLDQINDLYTVYSRLVVFDPEGRIRGCSRAEEAPGLVGSEVPADWPGAVRQLRDSQHYHVSAFADTALHDAGPTYVYLAALRSSGSGQDFLGGIAIVFQAQRELGAMLNDVLGERQGVAAFVDRTGRVLAATDPAMAAALAARAGPGVCLLDHQGMHLACARVPAKGYREFRAEGVRHEPVDALVALRLGTSDRRRTGLAQVAAGAPVRATGLTRLELAVFQVGPMRCALPADMVVEAVSAEGLVRLPGSGALAMGLMETGGAGLQRMAPVICGRRLLGVLHPPRRFDGVVLMLRLQGDSQPVAGLWVDDVAAVLEVDRQQLYPAPAGFRGIVPRLGGVLEAEVLSQDRRQKVLVQLLDAQTLADVFSLRLTDDEPSPTDP